MKKALLTIVLSVSILSVYPQSLDSDSVSYKLLDELTIEASKVIRKADMDVYIPSKDAVDKSRNGIQLLSNLMIPSLSVNDVMGSIKAAGQPVQIRINGREASLDQLRTLLPESVRKVEWLDNPGLRYNGAPYVLNFIVSNPKTGGSLYLHGIPAFNVAWGQYTADLKLNVGHSQW